MIPPILLEGTREILVINSDNGACIRRHLVHCPGHCEHYIHLMINVAITINASATIKKDIRVYMNINSRNMPKAIKEFKKQMIDADYTPFYHNWYLNLDQKFKHILMQPKQRETKYFLIDIDSKDLYILFQVNNQLRDMEVEKINFYHTPNGFHFITKPFNINKMKIENVEIKTDAFMLLYANGNSMCDNNN